MMSATTLETQTDTPVGMGRAMLAATPSRLTAILGSCVAIALYSPKLRLGMLSHVVLPQSRGPTDYPAKFADTAVPHMVSEFTNRNIWIGDLIARIAGGARMFGGGKFMEIGEANVQAAVEALQSVGIPIAARDVGGTTGRRICFDLATGSVTLETVGRPPHTI